MGILKGVASLILEEHSVRPFYGRILQLGRQEFSVTVRNYLDLARLHGVRLLNEQELEQLGNQRRAVTDQEFFRGLGFSEVHALDVGQFGEPEIDFDMNRDDLPQAYWGKYDCVVDGGTMEHVFHVPNVLRNIHRLLAIGGRVIHSNPASNAVEHGFYSFSPCLYERYYRTNGYRLDSLRLLNLGTKLLPIRMIAYNCLPVLPRTRLDGYLRGTPHHTFCIAAKTAESTADKIPQQEFYENLWHGQDESHAAQPRSARMSAKAKEFIKSNATIEGAARRWGVPLIRWPEIRATRTLLARVGKRY